MYVKRIIFFPTFDNGVAGYIQTIHELHFQLQNLLFMSNTSGVCTL